MTLSVKAVAKLDDSALFDILRVVIGYRLAGFPVDYIVGLSGITQNAVKQILIQNGVVARRGPRCRYHWVGTYEVTPELFGLLDLPPHIQRRVESASWGAGERDENGTRIRLEFPPLHTVPPLDR